MQSVNAASPHNWSTLFVCCANCELDCSMQQCNSATDAAVAAAKWVKYDSVLGAIYARRVYSFTILLVANKKKANKQSGQANKKREGGPEMRQADRTNNLQQPQVDLPRFASCDQGRVEFRGLSKINFKLKWKRKWSQARFPLRLLFPLFKYLSASASASATPTSPLPFTKSN